MENWADIYKSNQHEQVNNNLINYIKQLCEVILSEIYSAFRKQNVLDLQNEAQINKIKVSDLFTDIFSLS